MAFAKSSLRPCVVRAAASALRALRDIGRGPAEDLPAGNSPNTRAGILGKKSSRKKTWVLPLPERPPAMEDEIQVGGRHEYWYRTWSNEELLGALPPPPQFDPDLDSLRVSIAKTIGKVTVPREVTYWHPAIQRLLKADEERKEKLAK